MRRTTIALTLIMIAALAPHAGRASQESGQRKADAVEALLAQALSRAEHEDPSALETVIQALRVSQPGDVQVPSSCYETLNDCMRRCTGRSTSDCGMTCLESFFDCEAGGDPGRPPGPSRPTGPFL